MGLALSIAAVCCSALLVPPAGARQLQLRAVGPFDPVGARHDEPFEEVSRLDLEPPPASHRYLLVQFAEPVTAATHERVRRSGARALAYVPQDGLLLQSFGPSRTTSIWAAELEARFVGRFEAAYRLDPAIVAAANDGATGETQISVRLFPGEPAETWVVFLESLPGVRRVEAHGQRPDRPARITVELDAGALPGIAATLIHAPAVSWVQLRRPASLHNDQTIWIGQSYDRINGPLEVASADPTYALSATVWNRGLLGHGQVVAVADTGLEHTTCFWNDPGNPVVPQQVNPPGAIALDPNHRKLLALNAVSPLTAAFDGAFRHGTHVAATVAGDDLFQPATPTSAGHDHGDGVAPGAKIVFEDVGGPQTSSCSSAILVPSIEDLLLQEIGAGANISTNSWGTGDARAEEVDSVSWDHESFLAFFSAGNSGSAGVNPIAEAKNAVAVGAGENHDSEFVDVFGNLDPENMTVFSSVGPAADGRIKPDLIAPGFRVASNKFPTQYFSDAGDCDPGDPSIEVCFPSFGGCYFTYTDQTCNVDLLQGTSMAAPVAAGLAALARQYFTDGFYPAGRARPADAVTPSAALIKATLINGARNMTGHRYERRGTPQDLGPLADAPSPVQGWGRVMLDDALFFAGETRRFQVVDVPNTGGVASGATQVITLHVPRADEPLELTLVWTDPPAASYVGTALINDLDLELTAPDGTTYRGNQWTADNVNLPGDKISASNPAGRDSLNNVEALLIPTPVTGTYTVTIRGVNVPGHLGVLTQGYAVVMAGGIGEPAGRTAGLAVAKAAGDEITLSWQPSCRAGDTDYAVYEGTLAAPFDSHAPRVCTTSGALSETLSPGGDAVYYLVVPLSGESEGSYGLDGAGSERGAGSPAESCLPQELEACS